MFTSLNTLLDISNRTPPQGKFYLITEVRTDGSFLIHHFLSFYLKGGHKVCFLALLQSFTHYNSVSQKLGSSLTSSLENGDLVFIEGLKYGMNGMKIHSKDIPTDIENNPLLGLGNQHYSLKPLYERIKEEISKLEGPFLFLIDDVSVLLSLGVSIMLLDDFVQYCQSYVLAPERNGCLVILSHTEIEDSDEEIFKKHLIYKCNTELNVIPLITGYSKDVHGQLVIIDHNVGKMTGYPPQKTVQYKIMDKTVTLFAPGTSSSVL